MTNPRVYERVLLIFSTAMAGLMLFSAGMEAERQQYFSMMLAIIISGFFIGLIAAVISNWIWTLERKLDVAIDDAPKEVASKIAHDITNKLGEIFSEFTETHDDDLSELAHTIYLDVTNGGGRQPTKTEIARIEQRFHDESDGHYLRVHPNEEAGGNEYEVSHQPLTKSTGHSANNKRKSKTKE